MPFSPVYDSSEALQDRQARHLGIQVEGTHPQMHKFGQFLFEKQLLGKDAKSPDAVGIEFADKSVLGDKKNIKFRFDATYMDAVAKGKL